MRIFGWLVFVGLLSVPAHADETLLFIRHGEKPEAGLGQLNCKGLNRALALPAVLRRLYGRVDAVFAPNPSVRKPDDDDATPYDYVRPLATVEPTAVAFGIPVQADFGFEDIDALKRALRAPNLTGKTVLVGWEHHQIVTVVRDLVTSLGGDPAAVPRKWEKTDFDSIWEVKIAATPAGPKTTFRIAAEGLTAALPETCPAP